MIKNFFLILNLIRNQISNLVKNSNHELIFLTRCAVTPPALVEILGVDLLTSAFGTLTFVRGVAALIGMITMIVVMVIMVFDDHGIW